MLHVHTISKTRTVIANSSALVKSGQQEKFKFFMRAGVRFKLSTSMDNFATAATTKKHTDETVLSRGTGCVSSWEDRLRLDH